MKFNLLDIQKLIEEFKPVPTGNKFLDDRYLVKPSKPYYRFFYQLVQKYCPKTIVELGAWQGSSAAHFAGGCKDSTVVTIDHHTDPGDADNQMLCREAMNNLDNLIYVEGWTCNELYKEEKNKHSIPGLNAYPVVTELIDTIDILFIDSWHTKEQATKDWNAYRPLLAKEALVICDDILEGRPGDPIYGMRSFWDSLEGEKFLDDTLHPGYPMGFLKWTS